MNNEENKLIVKTHQRNRQRLGDGGASTSFNT